MLIINDYIAYRLQIMDKNQDGVISIDEFMATCTAVRQFCVVKLLYLQ